MRGSDRAENPKARRQAHYTNHTTYTFQYLRLIYTTSSPTPPPQPLSTNSMAIIFVLSVFTLPWLLPSVQQPSSSSSPVSPFLLVSIPLLFQCAAGISPDGITLLAFKSAITSDPKAAMAEWNASDPDPCRWPGVTCANFSGFPAPRVIAVTLSDRNLSGRIAVEIGQLAFLRRLNLHGNRFYGEIPVSLSNSTFLHSVSLYSNNLTGELPAISLCSLPRLQNLDLSSNALSGAIPDALRSCSQLQRLLLARNRLSGPIPVGVFPELRNLLILDLSSNSLSGEIPPDIGALHALSISLNLSDNHLSGEIPAALGDLPPYVAIDLRDNDLSGEVPQVPSLTARGEGFLVGNPGLCGYPLEVACDDPRSESVPASTGTTRRVMSIWMIAAISAADAVAVAAVGFLLVCLYWKSKRGSGECGEECCCWRCCRRSSRKGLLWCGKEEVEEEEEEEEEEKGGTGELVAVDGGAFGVELEELLRASAYVLGKGKKGIVYKVVVGNGMAVAVRRLEGGGSGYKEFKAEVEAIGKLRHPNVVRLRAYYWTQEEKLLVSDFVPGGTLASAVKGGPRLQSPLSWSIRLRIIKGVAQGLSFIHEYSQRKFVHGELKPSNILLDADFEPVIADFGLNRLLGLVAASSSSHTTLGLPTTKHYSSAKDRPNSYRAPEACLSHVSRPSQKWDVYSFGVVVLELLTGKSPEHKEAGELVRWVRQGFHEEKPMEEMVDVVLMQEVQSRKEVVEIFRVVLGCTETDPDSRPTMKAVVEWLEKLRL